MADPIDDDDDGQGWPRLAAVACNGECDHSPWDHDRLGCRLCPCPVPKMMVLVHQDGRVEND